MPWFNRHALRLDAKSVMDAVRVADLTPELARIVARGWTIRNGAVLLVAWAESYHGRLDSFPSTHAYESAVNGRAIPDMDLLESRSNDIRPLLLRRGVAFGWAALNRQSVELPAVAMVAEISVAPMLLEPAAWTGNVTFYSETGVPSDGDEGLSESRGELIVRLNTRDCADPLAT